MLLFPAYFIGRFPKLCSFGVTRLQSLCLHYRTLIRLHPNSKCTLDCATVCASSHAANRACRPTVDTSSPLLKQSARVRLSALTPVPVFLTSTAPSSGSSRLPCSSFGEYDSCCSNNGVGEDLCLLCHRASREPTPNASSACHLSSRQTQPIHSLGPKVELASHLQHTYSALPPGASPQSHPALS